MAAPSPTARVAPAGIYLRNGYQTLVTIEADTNIDLWEKAVKPAGLSGGDEIDTTSMHNTSYRTTRPRSLISLTPCEFTAAYDPDVYNQIIAAINIETTITVTFPDGSTLAFFGYLRDFEPEEATDGEQPEARVVIVPTNYDLANNVEAGPALASVAGT